MESIVRGIAVLGIAGTVSGIALARLAADIVTFPANPIEAASVRSGFHEYRFADLKVFEQSVFHIDEKYVDTSRLDFEAMFGAVLSAMEHEVPAAVFSREPGGSKVTVEVGEFLTVLEIDPVTNDSELIDAVRQVATLVREHSETEELPMGDPDVDRWQELEYAMVNGMLHEVLDPHSSLLPPRQASEMDDENRGEFFGLGVSVGEREGWLSIEKTTPDTPAAAAGLRPGDRIVRIDGETTLNMTTDEAVTRLRGPEGSRVNLEVAREGRKEPLQVEIIRAPIELNKVVASLLDGNVAYLFIPSFHAEAEVQLRRELTRLTREAGGSLKGVVLDLRGNPGGFYDKGWKVADAFLDEGMLVSTVDRDGHQVDRKEARVAGTEPKYPLAVLVDPRSASASEIVAGALRNNGRAVIIGQRSFGKGSVQNLHEYWDGSKLKLTVSRYLTPGDRSIQSVGIPADIELIPAAWNPEGESDRRISLHGTELELREADLPGALDADALLADQAAYVLHYLKSEAEADSEPEDDFEVKLARDVLLASPGWRRADVLTAAAQVVSRTGRVSEAGIADAMEGLGLDWSSGPAASRDGASPIELSLSPSTIPAGEQTTITLTATNVSEAPVYRLMALETEHDVVSGREFYFGKLEPGASREWSIQIRPPVGYPGEQAPLVFSLRDAGEGELGVVRTDLTVEASPRPRLEWELSFVDGDGDGRAEVEEEVTLALSVVNAGSGPAVGVVAKAQNRSGKALDLVDGTVRIGEATDDSGASCDPEDGDVIDRSCRYRLQPGARWSGELKVRVKDHPDTGAVALDLRVERRGDYDWAAIVRAGLDVYAATERITIPVAAPLPDALVRKPPGIEITHRPEAVATGERLSVSGLATDDTGLAHVMVFSGKDKVFHQGSGRSSTLTAIPFTADVEVEPGANTLVVQAVDRDGVQTTASIVAWSDEPALAKRE